MTPQEREVIDGIFSRLRTAADQPRDPETERYIADLVRQQPYAPYAMAQAVYVQEQALTNMQQQVEALQAELQTLQNQPQGGGGFLSSLFGGGPRSPQPMAHRPGMGMGNPGMRNPGMAPQGMPMQPLQPGQGGPWGQGPQQRQGGGFLASAAMTAAGVAGGLLVGNALMNAFGGGSAQAAEPAAGLMPSHPQTAADPHEGGQDHAQDHAHDAGYDAGGFGDDDGFNV